MNKLTVIICFIMISLTSSCQRKGEDCIYLIPQGFQGNVLIVFNQEDGSDTVYEGDSRVYKIDTSGVLKTKFKVNYGMQRNSYFYQDNLGNRKIIKYAPSLDQVKGSEVLAFKSETGKDFDPKKSVDRVFEMFTIALPSNLDSIGNRRSEFTWGKLNP